MKMLNFFMTIAVLFLGSVASAVQNGEVVSSAVLTASTPSPTISERQIKLYEVGKTDGPVLYTEKILHETLPSGNLSIKSTIKDMKGNIVFNESIITKGSHVISQSSDVQQTKRHLELEVKDDHIYFRTRALGSEKTEEPKEDVESLPPSFITGALSEVFAIEHFDELMAGSTVYTKMGIMEIRDSISFKFYKKEMSKINGREVMVVAMKPTSFFIALMLNNFYLYFDVKEKKLVHFVGRTPLWKEVNGKLKAWDAEMVFE